MSKDPSTIEKVKNRLILLLQNRPEALVWLQKFEAMAEDLFSLSQRVDEVSKQEGPAGPQGEKGESVVGPKGDKGDKGDSIVGPKGGQGDKGDSVTGPRGPHGDPGESIVGPAGRDGSPDTPEQIVAKLNDLPIDDDQFK